MREKEIQGERNTERENENDFSDVFIDVITRILENSQDLKRW